VFGHHKQLENRVKMRLMPGVEHFDRFNGVLKPG
jgi:hypothetical protein